MKKPVYLGQIFEQRSIKEYCELFLNPPLPVAFSNYCVRPSGYCAEDQYSSVTEAELMIF